MHAWSMSEIIGDSLVYALYVQSTSPFGANVTIAMQYKYIAQKVKYFVYIM